MRAQQLTELGNAFYPYVKQYSDENEAHFFANNEEIIMTFDRLSPEVIEIEFSVNGESEITGTGDAFKIFATVMNIINRELRKFIRPTTKTIVFSAANNEPSRIKLYTRGAPTITKMLGTGWQYSGTDTNTAYTKFVWTKQQEQLDELVKLSGMTKDNAKLPGKSLLGMNTEWLLEAGYAKILEVKGSSVYAKRFKTLDNEIRYVVTNGENLITAVLITGPFGKSQQVLSVVAGPNNELKLPVLYHSLITKLGVTLVSDYTQSEGGARIWQSLAQMRGVNIFGWNVKTKKAVNIDPKLADQQNYYVDPDDDFDVDEHGDMQHVILVAEPK